MLLRISKCQRGAPRSAEQQPALDAEMPSQQLDVGNQVVRRVGGKIDVRPARMRRAAPTAALVEQDDAIAVGIEVSPPSGRTSGARPAVKD